MCHLRMILIAGILSLRPKAVQRNAKLVRDLKKATEKSNIPANVEARPDLIPPSGSKLSRVLVGDAQELDDAGDWGESDTGESDHKDPAQIVQSELLEHKSNLQSWEKRKQ